MIKNENNISYSYKGKTINIDDNITLSDPTYDLTFKYLFSQVNFWEKNIKSFLDSLIFENKIQKIELLPNEFIDTQKDSNNNGEHLKLLKSDLSYKCKTNQNEQSSIITLINIEMQLGYPLNFLERLIDYGIALRKANIIKTKENKPKYYKTTVLGFINTKENYPLNSYVYYLSKFDLQKGTFIEKIDDFLEVIIINLKEISEKLIKDEEICILNKKIGDKGKNWLKLLCLRHWGIKEQKYSYKFPNIEVDENIKTAIKILSEFSSKKKQDIVNINNIEESFRKTFYETIGYYSKEFIEQKSNEIAEKKAEEKAKKLAEKKAEEMAKKLAETKSEEMAKKLAEIKSEEMAKKLAEKKAEEMAKETKKIENNENWDNFLDVYKKQNISLEILQHIDSFKFIFDMGNEKLEELWGKDELEKLDNLKNFIGKKRKFRADIK
jgi:flagellar biosynthesis GTPase FlhF